jgi:hypothetical protein
VTAQALAEMDRYVDVSAALLTCARRPSVDLKQREDAA